MYDGLAHAADTMPPHQPNLSTGDHIGAETTGFVCPAGERGEFCCGARKPAAKPRLRRYSP
jgi:hypothetical protein